jgi:hypothetical protein
MQDADAMTLVSQMQDADAMTLVSQMQDADAMTLVSQMGPTVLKTVGGLGLLLFGGRVVLRRVFEVSGTYA